MLQPNQATECINVDLSKGSLYPLRGLSQEKEVTGIYVFQEDNTLIANSDPTDVRSYARFGNRIYWTNGTFNSYGIMRYDGTSAGTNAVPPPVPDGTIGLTHTGTAGSLIGDYVYAYTYVDTDGIESPPSGYIGVSLNKSESVTVTITGETNTPADFSFRRIYRTGGANPTFNLIGETTGLSFVDSTRDIDVPRIEMTTITNSAPPSSLINLVENNGTMWASVGAKVHFSVNGQPEYWSPLDYIQLNDDCTGIGKFADNIVVFTRADAYIISGYDRDTVVVNKLPYREGCVHHRSIANVGNYLVWVSKNGVCVFDGSIVKVVTRNLLSWNDLARAGTTTWDDLDAIYDANLGFDVTDGLALQDRYYGIFSEGVGILQVEDNLVASMVHIPNCKTVFYDDINNFLTVITDDDGTFNARSVDTSFGNPMTALWKTGQLFDGDYETKKQYRKIKFDATPIRVTVWTNDKEFVSEGKAEFFLPSGFIGNYIQMQIETSNEIRSCQYEFGVLHA